MPQTIWGYREVGHTQDAKKQYVEILNAEEVFTTPKPVALIKRILQLSTDQEDLILDSFAGSGTTAQARLFAKLTRKMAEIVSSSSSSKPTTLKKTRGPS